MPTQSFTVILTPFNSNSVTSIRTVEVPVGELNACRSGGADHTLDLIYQYGQNDFQPRKNQRSVSIGDIIVSQENEFNDNEFWVVEEFGFRKLTTVANPILHRSHS